MIIFCKQWATIS